MLASSDQVSTNGGGAGSGAGGDCPASDVFGRVRVLVVLSDLVVVVSI